MSKQSSCAAALFRLARPWHYVKNLLVFVPLFFSGQLFSSPTKVVDAGLAFACMSLAASGTYVMNDIHDHEHDRQHPTKKNRPIASGLVSAKLAVIYAGLLFLLSIALHAFICVRSGAVAYATAVLAAYIVCNVGYSVFGLKNMPIIDVSIVALGFVLRILYGSAAAGIRVSSWLLLTVLMGSYYMALGKRRNELRDSGEKTRAVLRHYTEEFLSRNMYMFLTLTIAFYSLWSADVAHPYAVLSVPLVAVIAMCYNLNIEGDSDGDPIEVILRDKKLIALGVVYVLMMLYIVYARGGAVL